LTIAFVTLGCKVNQVDSDALRQRMEAAGWTCVEVENPSIGQENISMAPTTSPDILVINSCAVTAESERKTRQKLRHFRAMYRDCILVLTGCAVQVSKEGDYPEADIVLGHRDTKNLAQYIDEFRLGEVRIACVSSHHHTELFDGVLPRESIVRACTPRARTRAHLKIEDGCDRFCAYCIIPHARGRVRSMPLEDIRCNIQSLDAQGFREVVLVGINLAAYGSDLGCCDLSDILTLFSTEENISNIKRVRLGSLEPDLLTPELISKLENLSFCSKIELCPHFHVSLQSGCDSTLNRMNRQYSPEEYFSLIKHLRALFPGAAITTDILVGFPGESEAEFEASLTFAQTVGFAKIHVFPYSPRPGTSAADMLEQIPRTVKQERTKKMLALADECHTIFLNSQIGRTLEVLPEEPHPAGGMRGYSANYTPVRITDAGTETQNQVIPVKVTSVRDDFCVGALS